MLQNGESPLHAAALFGHGKIVKTLVDAGAQTDLKNKVCFFLLLFVGKSSQCF